MAWTGTNLCAGSSNGHVYVYGGGTAWTDAGTAGSVQIECLAWLDGTLFAGSDDGHVYAFAGGTSWTDLGTNSSSQVNALTWNGSNLLAGCDNGHVYQYDGVSAWEDIGDIGGLNISDLAWTGVDLYASSREGVVSVYAGSSTWATTGIGDVGVTDVRSMCWNDTNIYAGDSTGEVWRYDGSETWADVGDTGSDWANTMLWNGSKLYAGLESGRVVQYDSGTTWSDTGGPGTDPIESLAWNGSNLFAGSNDTGTVSRNGALPAPTVVSITPDSGFTSGTVSITNLAGTGFESGATVKLTKVGETDIDGTSVSFVSATKLTCDFDLTGALTGNWDVVVTNPDSQAGTLTGGFMVSNAAPTVTAITPDTGSTGATVNVTDLAGTNFYGTPTVALKKGGETDIAATDVNVTSPTQITCTFDLTGAATGQWDVYVENPDAQWFTLTDGFTVNLPAPTVSSITPNSGISGSTVSITDLAGTNFYGAPTILLKKTGQTDINGSSVTVESAIKATCDFDLTGAVGGDWDVYYQNPDGQNATLADGFHVNYPAAPAVTSIAPNNGTNDGTVSITDLAGSGFRTGAGVKLTKTGHSDIVATNVIVVSDMQITCDLDLTGVRGGAWDVTVTNDDGQSGTLGSGFTVFYSSSPVVTSITPNSGPNTDPIGISDLAGTGFQPGASVVFSQAGQPDIIANPVTIFSSIRIICLADITGANIGKWSVTVINDDGQQSTLADAFTVQYPLPPIPTDITPAQGVNDGPVHITDLAGTGFRDGAVVNLKKSGQPDIAATDVVVTGGTTVACDFDLTGVATGDWDVVVRNLDDQEGVLSSGFLVEFPNAPSITDIVPSLGANNTTISTTIGGSGFYDGATVQLQKIGQSSITATNVVVAPDQQHIGCDFNLTGVAVGDWDVYVENTDHQSSTLPTGFQVRYANPPTVDSVTPPRAMNNLASVHLTVQGAHLRNGATVTLTKTGQPDIVATGVVIAPDGAQITCYVNLNGVAVGDWTLVVENDDGQTGQTTFHVNYSSAPAVTSIAPPQAPNTTACALSVTGTGFRTGATATLTKIGQTDIVATSVVVAPGGTQINCSVDLDGVAAGDWSLVVMNDDGQTGHRTFHVNYPAAPALTSIAPSRAKTGGVVHITDLAGSGFYPGAAVTLKKSGKPNIVATNVVLSLDGQHIACDVGLSGAAIGSWNVEVKNDDGQLATMANGFTIVYPNPPAVTAITPNSGSGSVSVTNLAGTGFHAGATVKLSMSGQTIRATSVTVVSATKITCLLDVSRAAPGNWDVVVTNNDGQTVTKTAAFKVVNSNTTWYLAEGTSDYGFDTYVTMENPNSSAVTAQVTYMTKTGPFVRSDITLPPASQTVINPRNDIGATDFSTKVVCKEGKTICADRRMVWTGPGSPSSEGHSSVGVTAPAKTWYLAEGSSKWGFECWLLIQNPGSTIATCKVTYMVEGVGPQTVSHDVPANSRASFSMAGDIGPADASIKVEANVPVISERSMYRNNRREGHCSVGTTTPATDFYLAEGTTDWGFTTYLLVQNPNATAITVNVTYMTPTGAVNQPAFSMTPNSRKTINVNDVVSKKDCSIRVNGSAPIIAERAMYWGAGTPLGEACHDSVGMSAPHMTFYLPDGETFNGTETWTLVQNPNAKPVSVEVSYLTPTGQGNKVVTATIPANSRQSFSMGDAMPSARASVMVTSKTAGLPIMVERSMYWNARGAGTDTIGGYSD